MNDFVEYCWSQCKGYADAKYFKGRFSVQLADHIREVCTRTRLRGLAAWPGWQMQHQRWTFRARPRHWQSVHQQRACFAMAIRVCASATLGCKTIITADDELDVSEHHGLAFCQVAVRSSRTFSAAYDGWHVTCRIVGRPLNAIASRRAGRVCRGRQHYRVERYGRGESDL
jgi:hypothetical protein